MHSYDYDNKTVLPSPSHNRFIPLSVRKALSIPIPHPHSLSLYVTIKIKNVNQLKYSRFGYIFLRAASCSFGFWDGRWALGFLFELGQCEGMVG